MQSTSFRPQAPTFSLLTHLAGDSEQLDSYSQHSCGESWLAAERACAIAQSEDGILTRPETRGIARAARYGNIDPNALWRPARNLGYPIHDLVHQAGSDLGPRTAGKRVDEGQKAQ